MDDKIVVKFKSPTNAQIASYFGYKNESTVRKWKRDDKDLYTQKVQEYANNTLPFVSIKDYAKYKDIDISSLEEKIKSNDIPHIWCKTDKKLLKYPFVPSNTLETLQLKDEIKKLHNAKVITFANKKGGVGKTTTTVNLASTLAYQGYDVLIVDMDTQANTTAMFDIYQGSDYTDTIIDLMYDIAQTKVGDDAKSIINNSTIEVGEKLGLIGKLDILPNSGTFENEKKFENLENELRQYTNVNSALDDVLSHIRDQYDFIVIDTPPRVDLTIRLASMASDYVLMVFTAEKMSKDGIPSFLAPLANLNKIYHKQKNKNINILGGMINLYTPNIKLQRSFALEIEDEMKEVLSSLEFDTQVNFLEDIDEENILFDTKIKRATRIQDTQLNGYGTFLSYDSLTNETLDSISTDFIKNYFNLSNEIVNRIMINLVNSEEI